MPSKFDRHLAKLDQQHADQFGEQATINGTPVSVVYDEYTSTFEGMTYQVREIEIANSAIPARGFPAGATVNVNGKRYRLGPFEKDSTHTTFRLE